MSRLVSIVLTLFALVSVTFTINTPAYAADLAAGAGIFTANCASCHLGGKNIIMADKSLKKDALEKYEMNSIEAIVKQISQGKNAMPAFTGRLTLEQSQDVAAYVLDKAEKGW